MSIALTLSLQKSEGSRAKATKGEAVVNYCDPLATRDLESSGFCYDGVDYLFIRAATLARVETALLCCAT